MATKKNTSTKKKTSAKSAKAPAKKTAPKKKSAKKAAPKTAVVANISPETVEKVIARKENDDVVKYSLGERLPYYLL